MAISRDNSGDTADGASFVVGTSSTGGTLVTGNMYSSVNTLTITLGGVAFTNLPNSPRATGGGGFIYSGYWANVSAGSKTLSNGAGRSMALVSYLNSPTSNPIGANSVVTGVTGTITSTNSNSWIGAFIQSESGSPSYVSGPASTNVINTSDRYNDSNGTVAAGLQVQVWVGGTQQVNSLFEILPFTGATASLPFKTLLGVGK